VAPCGAFKRITFTGLFAVGCAGASADNGLEAHLRLNNAQFVAGALEAAPDAVGPRALANLGVGKLYPGVQNIPLSGDVEEGTSVLIGLAGDAGHWIVPAPLRDLQILDSEQYTFSARMSLSPDTPMGTETLLVRGVGADGSVAIHRLEGGPPFCITPFPYPDEGLRLLPDETLVIVSDGVNEALDGSGALFGHARLLDAIRGAGSATAMIESIRSAVRRFEAGTDPTDDLTVMALRFRPRP